MLEIKWADRPTQRIPDIMNANSNIFSTTLFGTSSGKTSEDQAAFDRKTQEMYLEATNTSNMKTTVPRIPSNQKIMKD